MQDGFGVRYARANFVIFLLANFKYLLMRELINRMIFYNKIKSVMPFCLLLFRCDAVVARSLSLTRGSRKITHVCVYVCVFKQW